MAYSSTVDTIFVVSVISVYTRGSAPSSLPLLTTPLSSLYRYLEDYNATAKTKMPLVMFVDAVGHVSRISRVIRQPQGNALLLGLGGSGRQSLTRLAAYVAGCTIFRVTITKAYGVANLLEDFKPLYRQAGCAGKGTAFLFTDKEVKEEAFLEYINIFLNTGEVPNLFARDEVDAILGEVGEAFEREMPKTAEPTAANH